MHRSTKKEVLVARASNSILLLFLGLPVLFLFFRRRFATFRLDNSLGSLLRLLRQLPRFALSFCLNTLLSSNSQHFHKYKKSVLLPLQPPHRPLPPRM